MSLILILVPRSIYHSWLKLAAWALPLAFLNIASTPVWPMTQGLGMFPGGPDRTEITATDGRFFLVLSLLVIVLAFVRERLIATGKRSLVEVEDIVKELWALVGTIAGLIFAALSFKDSLIPSSATIDAALSHFFGSIVFGILALGYASFLAYRKVHTRAHLGWKLMLTFLLSGATIIVFTLSVIMGV